MLPWPKITVRSFVRIVNYETGSMRDEILFARAEGLGGGGYPHAAPQRNEQYASGDFAWNVVGNANLVDNLATLKMPVDRILPLHGRVVPATDLYAAAGQNPPQ